MIRTTGKVKKMELEIKKIWIDDMENPIGLDAKRPQISWVLDSDKKDTMQDAYRVQVYHQADKRTVWDSGLMKTSLSSGIVYEGETLEPCTAYDVIVEVYDNYGQKAVAGTRFETRMLKTGLDAWNGAHWIAAPRFHVAADTRGVFVIESTFCFGEGGKRAGIVFGANDYRLNHKNLNEYRIQGENYIRFEICMKESGAFLDIYRVGYAKQDRADTPYASVPLKKFGSQEGGDLLSIENMYDFHTIKVVVDGNNAFTYFDDILADAKEEEDAFEKKIVGRTLNPRGFNDVLTYPRLNEIGFFAAEGETVYFKNITVKNLRQPGNIFIYEAPKKSMYGNQSIFDDVLKEDKGCFKVSGMQVTKNPSRGALPMFRASFNLNESIRSARLYITSRGIYDCSINGKAVTDRQLSPGLTQYDKRINYQTYDITDKLKSGKNGIGITVGSGWWSDAQTFVVKNYNYFGDQEAVLAKLEVRYESGKTETIVTNTDTWRYSDKGPYKYAGLFLGEQFDARKKDIYEEYSKADYDDHTWESPATGKTVKIEETRTMPAGFGRTWPEVNAGEAKIEGGYDAPVHIVKVLPAKSRKKLEEKVWLYDFGQEMAGVPRISFHEKSGTKIIIRYCEVLYPDMNEYRGNEGKPMFENYRDATSTDIYICSGKGEKEVYQPKFTFHGFRYVEIMGVENPPEVNETEGMQFSSISRMEGSFQSSNQLLNRFAENVYWSQLCNFISIPTDCPQRNERMGWAGDTHVFCKTALQNSSLKKFYERNLQAMLDLQTEEGRFPEIAPIGGGFGGITYECASIFIAWELYQQYGDAELLKHFYPGMKKYMDYMKDKGLPGEGDPAVAGPLGDWLAPEETDLQLIWNAFYYKEAVCMQKIAAVLRKETDEREYRKLAEECKAYWNQTFITPLTGKTRGIHGETCDTQCSYVLALEFGLAENKELMKEHLLRKTRSQHHTVGTGFFGTGLLNQALCNVDAADDAYQLMLQTEFPSWLYPVTQGATTIWERWDSFTKEKGFGGQNAMNSFNHYSLGSVLSWMYSYILGIRRLEEYPGYSRFLLEPVMGPLEYAKGSVSTPHGMIKSGWKKEADGHFAYECEIPVNTKAVLKLPGRETEVIGSGRYCYNGKMEE